MSSFEEIYGDYLLTVIAPLHRRVREILDGWKEPEFWQSHKKDGLAIPEPIYLIKYRDKRYESILDKFERLRDEFHSGPTLESLQNLRDVFGARIVTFIPDQIQLIDTAIRTSEHLHLAVGYTPRCYLPESTIRRIGLSPQTFDIRGVKDSGYASIHYFVQLAEPVTEQNPIFELQVRTMLENVWAEIEHQLGYKQDQQTEFSVSRQFRVIGHQMAALDDHFDFVYDRLNYLQARSNPQHNDVLNAENLPTVVDAYQLILQQGEVGTLIRILETYGVTTVGHLRSVLKQAILDPIREEFKILRPNGHPSAFDILPAVATLSPGASAEEARAALRTAFKHAELVRNKRRELEDLIRSGPRFPDSAPQIVS